MGSTNKAIYLPMYVKVILCKAVATAKIENVKEIIKLNYKKYKTRSHGS